jgi:steroid delta-isomerase-like uncharacterized protein
VAGETPDGRGGRRAQDARQRELAGGGPGTTGDDLAAARTAVVREHLDSENRHDFAATLATFAHPRYELIPTGDVYDGEVAVQRYYDETRRAFPDQRNRDAVLYAAGDAVIAEFVLEGTHLGSYRGLPATGRAFTCPMCAVFAFAPGTAQIVCERVYFDAATILRQLGVAHDPLSRWGRIATVLNHPVTVGRAVLRGILRGGRASPSTSTL